MYSGLLTLIQLSLLETIFPPARQKECRVVILHKRLITPLEGKMIPALRVVAKKLPLGVARRSFGMTKPRFSRLDWWLFSHNSDN
jgi:hypothetical protein